jgi:thymidine phosphorylase
MLTDMSVPLGLAVGNAVEVAESVEVLKGGGPADVVELTVALAREMLSLAGITEDPAQTLASGRAYETWCRMIAAQGGDPEAPLPTARHVHMVTAESTGVLSHLDAYAVGVAAWRLGAGRARKEDAVQHAAGILCHAKPGDKVSAGDPLLELRTDTPDAVPAALAALQDGYTIGTETEARASLLLDTVR